MVVLSSLVGDAISSAERDQYKLFADFPDNKPRAYRFLQTPDGQLLLEGTLVLMSDGERDRVFMPYTQTQFLVTKAYVEKQSTLFTSLEAARKDSAARLSIYTRNGDHITGKLLTIQDTLVIVLTDYGVLEIPLDAIKSSYVKKDQNEVAGEMPGEVQSAAQPDDLPYFANPTPTRYMVAPSAIPFPKGEGYYQNLYATVHTGYYGLSDHVSVGGGLETISLLLASPLLFGTVRVGYQVKPKLYLGGGAIAIGGLNETSFFAGGGYANATFGTIEKSVTTTLGVLHNGWQPVPVFILSAMKRQQRRVCLVTENWFLAVDGTPVLILSGGLRIIGESFSVDLSLLSNPQLISGGIPALPFAGFTIKI